MILLCLSFIAVFIIQVQATEEKCDGVNINGVMHIKEVLKTNLDSPYQFSIDYATNTLFFSSSIQTEDQRFQLGYLNLETKELNVVNDIKDGFASAVDHSSNTIYLGANGGIYQFNVKSKQTNQVYSIGQNIWQMFYNNGLYYTTYPTEEAYFFANGNSQKVPELKGTKVMLIALDGKQDIYFTNSSGLFKYIKSNKSVLNLGEYIINGLNSDVNGKLYFTSPNGIFKINEDLNTVERLVTLDNVYAAAVEKDGSILCGTEDSIVRFKKSDKCT
ncbi:ommochrome-binding protein-like isoform X2 [Battus philenor]